MAGIKHKTTKAGGDKGLASEWNDDHEQTGNHDVEQNQFLNQVIENRVDFPAGPVEGQIIYRTDEDILYIWDGAAWIIHTPAIKKGTHYWSCAGTNFMSANPDTDQFHYSANEGGALTDAVGIVLSAPVFLPHGAIVTAAIVYGSAGLADETWTLWRSTLTPVAEQVMASANIRTEDNTINHATIDNQNYKYWLETSSLDIDALFGARITYTL